MLRLIPNALCLLRMLLAIPVAWLLLHERYAETLGVLGFAAATDGLDGFLAKRCGWTSELGKILDPLADKILLVTVFLMLAMLGLVPVWVAAIAVLRDLIITSGAIAYRVLFGPLEGHPTIISKFNTLCQILYVLTAIAAARSGAFPPALQTALASIVVATTLISGAEYVLTYSRRAAAVSSARASSPRA